MNHILMLIFFWHFMLLSYTYFKLPFNSIKIKASQGVTVHAVIEVQEIEVTISSLEADFLNIQTLILCTQNAVVLMPK